MGARENFLVGLSLSGKKNRLTETLTDQIQSYYGKDTRENVSDLQTLTYHLKFCVGHILPINFRPMLCLLVDFVLKEKILSVNIIVKFANIMTTSQKI